MSTRLQKIRLGIFMLLSFLLLFGSVAILAGMKLWNPKDQYYIRFRESISGLENGSTVKMKGVRVGQVDAIDIGKDVESVIVTLSLAPGTPVTADTRGIMTSIGITGLKFIELTGGTKRSVRIKPNNKKSIIKAGSSTLETLTGKATDIAWKMEGVLNNLLRLTSEGNRLRVQRVLENADKLAVSWDDVARSNKGRIKKILGNVDRASVMMEKASGNISRVVQDNSTYLKDTLVSASAAARSLKAAVQNLRPQATLKSINDAADSVRKRVNDPAITKALSSLDSAAGRLTALVNQLGSVVKQRDRQLGATMRNLDQASAFLKQFARSIKERPSLLLRGETRKERTVP